MRTLPPIQIPFFFFFVSFLEKLFLYFFFSINPNLFQTIVFSLQKFEHHLEGSFELFELVYLVTALVPSETACLANSPGKMRRTAVWISRDEMVERLL
jgi:hypothetical protein